MLTKKSRAPLRVVTVNDPAIDRDSAKGEEALKKYVKSRDMADLVLHPNQKPTVFVLRPLPHNACLELEFHDNVALKCALAFAMSIDHVENMDDAPAFEMEPNAGLDGWKVLKAESRKIVAEAIGEQIIREVGAVAYQASVLSAHQKKAFSLPPGCTVDWAIDTPATDPTTPTTASG